VLKDYTTGQMVFCHIRPDFDVEKHKQIVQAGFHLHDLDASNLDSISV